MRKILIVITTSFVQVGGLTTVMLNYYKAMDKSGLLIDFASTNEPEEAMLSLLKSNNSSYYNLGPRKKHTIRYAHNLMKLIKRNEYDVVHINGNSSTMIIESIVARICKVQDVICHLHAASSSYPMINKILSPVFRKTYSHAIAVSKQAGDWLFKQGYMVLNNAIDVEKYRFNLGSRSEIRGELGIEDKYVIGTVGKLNPLKNQTFLLELFAEYSKKDDDSVLVIVGGGPLDSELRHKAETLGISDRTIFLGLRPDVQSIIQGFDVFVFPSIHEGLGLVLIEAQAAGLSCIASDTIPKETHVSDYIDYLSLQSDFSIWIERINSIRNREFDRNAQSIDACKSINEHGYNVVSQTGKLEKIYRGNAEKR